MGVGGKGEEKGRVTVRLGERKRSHKSKVQLGLQVFDPGPFSFFPCS